MTELEKLLDQKTKAEAMAEKQQLSKAQLVAYDNICKRILALERLRFLCSTAPKSMDPEKINDHWCVVKTVINEVEPRPNDEEVEFLTKAGKLFNGYKATSVTSYNTQVTNFIRQFIVLWKKTNNYK